MNLLTIITINRNNAVGLEKTIKSVLFQTCLDIDYVVVDGASTDESVNTIKHFSTQFGNRLRWISEPDNGIYNAMNKGIGMATGEYVEFLNSGDYLVDERVIERMFIALEQNGYPSILYGNMLKSMLDGKVIRDKCFAGQEISFLGFYYGSLNHSPALIRRSLFREYGLYDESLRIVSDWKWYMQAIILGQEKPVYTDLDVTLFDMTGISETNKDLDKQERRKVVTELIPGAFLKDYDEWAFSIGQVKRLKRHPWAYRIMWFIERCLFKFERIQNRMSKETTYR